MQKAFEISPELAQTGPAKRGDNSIISKHISLLDNILGEKEHAWKKLYALFSEEIRNCYK
jgi:predicted short-subunit dehydrogenase-like oxidoreductase (DUF2520 family)